MNNLPAFAEAIVALQDNKFCTHYLGDGNYAEVVRRGDRLHLFDVSAMGKEDNEVGSYPFTGDGVIELIAEVRTWT